MPTVVPTTSTAPVRPARPEATSQAARSSTSMTWTSRPSDVGTSTRPPRCIRAGQ